MAAGLVACVGVADARLVEAEHLIVIGVRQLVQQAPRLDVDLARLQQLGRLRNVDAMGEIGGIAVFYQPVGFRVILHRLEVAVAQVEHDGHALQLGQALRADHRGDIAEARFQVLEDARAQFRAGGHRRARSSLR